MNQSQSHTDFEAAHAARMADIAAERNAEIDRAARIAAAAEAAQVAARDAELRAHDDAQNQRVIDLQRYAASVFDGPVAAYVADPSRPNVAAIAAALKVVEAQAHHAIGRPLEGSRGPGVELLHALMAARIATAPEAAQTLSMPDNISVGELGTHYARAVTALRSGDLASAQSYLAAVEVAIGQVQREGSRGAGEAAARWEVVRFGGSLERRAAALKALEADEFERLNPAADRQMRASAMQAAADRRPEGESFADGFRRIYGELKQRAAAAIEAAPAAPAAPAAARKPSRASASSDGEDDVAAMRQSEGSAVTI